MKSHFFTFVFSLLLFSVSYSQYSFDSCLVAHYPFNSNADDISGNLNHGVVEGATLTYDRFGVGNMAYSFDGEDDYISILPVSDLSQIGDFTISLWYYFEEWEVQTGGTSGNYDRQYIFDGHSMSNNVTTGFINDGFSINANLTDNYDESIINSIKDLDGTTFQFFLDAFPNFEYAWHHNVFVREGDKTYHYFDDELIYTGSVDNAILDMQHYLYIGTFCGNNPNYNNYNYNFDGMIDDIRIYTCALDSLAVGVLYNEPPYSVNELSKNESVEIFPNPASDIINVNCNNLAQNGNYKIAILNTLGTIVFEEIISQDLLTINTKDIGAKGIYFIRISSLSDDFIGTRKLILE